MCKHHCGQCGEASLACQTDEEPAAPERMSLLSVPRDQRLLTVVVIGLFVLALFFH